VLTFDVTRPLRVTPYRQKKKSPRWQDTGDFLRVHDQLFLSLIRVLWLLNAILASYCPIKQADKRWQEFVQLIHGRANAVTIWAGSCPEVLCSAVLFRPRLAERSPFKVRGVPHLSHQSVERWRFFGHHQFSALMLLFLIKGSAARNRTKPPAK